MKRVVGFGGWLNARFAGRREWILPAIISFVPWIWLLPVSTYLYAQDSLGYLNPFGANNSPLLQFNPLFSWTFPVPAEQPNFFIQGINFCLEQVLPAVGPRERVLVTIGVGIGVLGVWLLLRRILILNGISAGSFRGIRALAAGFYIMNPFTLSLIWWHIEGWCYFYIFVPYLIWFLLGATYLTRFDPRDLAVVTVVGVSLGAGLASGFAVSVTLAILVFLAAVLVRPKEDYGSLRRKMIRFLTVLVAEPLLIGWTVVPYVLIPHAAFTSSNYVNPADLVSTFSRQSSTSTLWNVVTFSAISWVFNAPGSYGIPRIETVLLIGGALTFLLLIAGATLIKLWRGLGLLYVLALASIALSSGANPPFGPVDAALLSLHGPFLVLVNAYYFLCQYYALLATVLVLVVPVQFLRRSRPVSWTEGGPQAAKPQGSAELAEVPKGQTQQPQTPQGSSGPWSTSGLQAGLGVFGVVLVGALLIASYAPFATGRVFQPAGANVDEINLPPSFGNLGSVLRQDGDNPSYFTLVLPMSSELGVPQEFAPNERFLDTTDLIASFVPGPVIQADTGAPAADLMSFLAGCAPCDNLTLEFELLHIAWVVWDPYVDESAYAAQAAPSGERVNFSMMRESLNDSFGAPQQAGIFEVYAVQNPLPLLTLNEGLNVVEAPNRLDYYGFVNNLGQANASFQLGMAESVWTSLRSEPVPGLTTVGLYPFDGGALTLPVWAEHSAMVLNSSNTITPLSDWSKWLHSQQNGSRLELASPVLDTLGSRSNISTNMTPDGAGYSSQSGSTRYLRFTPSFSGETSVVMDLSIASNGGSQTWLNTVIADGQLSVVVQMYTPSSSANTSLSVAADWKGVPFAWHNVLAPNAYSQGLQNVRLLIEPTSVAVSVDGSEGNVSATVFFGSLRNDSANPGFDASAAPPNASVLSTYGLEVSSVYPALTLSNLTVSAPLPIRDVFSVVGDVVPTVVPAMVAESQDGDWSIKTLGLVGPGQYELVLAAAPSGLWQAAVAGATVQVQSIASDCSVFAVSFAGSPRIVSAAVHYDVYLDDGLYTGIGEVVALPIVSEVLRRRLR